jgi:hypothetical protein
VTASRFSRAPRKPVAILKSERIDTLRRVQADPRFRARIASARYCLVVAITERMDGEGKWWLKVKDWAELVGCSMSTVKRAILEFERAGLIRSVPYLRPDGKQGSTTYWLDPKLVARLPDLDADSEPPCPEPPPSTNNRSSLQASLGEEPLFNSGGSPVNHLVDGNDSDDGRQGGSHLTHLVDEQGALILDDHPSAYREAS